MKFRIPKATQNHRFSILTWSNDSNDLGYPFFRKTFIYMQLIEFSDSEKVSFTTYCNSHLFRQMFPISIFSQPQWAVDRLPWWIKCCWRLQTTLQLPVTDFFSQSVQVLTALAVGFHPFLLWDPPFKGGGGGEKTEIFHFRGGLPPQHLEIFHLPKVKYFS